MATADALAAENEIASCASNLARNPPIKSVCIAA